MAKRKKAAVGPKRSKKKKRVSRVHTPPADVIAYAQQSERETGVPASVTLAQWALESGWGKSSPNNNPFGMKATSSQAGFTSATKEQGASGLVKTTAKFRSFENLGEAFKEHGEYLKRRFPWAMEHTDSPDDFISALQSHKDIKYATDKDYVSKITGIINHNNFRQYDKKPADAPKPSGQGAAIQVIDGEQSVLLGKAMRVAAHVGSPHSGGGKVIEGSQTVFVGPKRLPMSREDDVSNDGYQLKTDVHDDILVG
ncbi:MAG: glucosaminidase domain-containing protein [Polyangiaceae bacterium]